MRDKFGRFRIRRLTRRLSSPLGAVLVCALILAACGDTTGSSPSTPATVTVSAQNASLLVGVNRVGVALLDSRQAPIVATNVSMQVVDSGGQLLETRPLENIGPQYGGIPVYVGLVKFPDVGEYEYRVHGTLRSGQPVVGSTHATVELMGSEIPVGSKVPLVKQALPGPGITLANVDSGVPPDDWHTLTIAGGVAQHRAMVLYFGDPAYCPSRTCGPTRQILQQLCSHYCAQLVFEHIETYYPAGPPGPTATANPAFDAFGLQTDPWIYFVDAAGVVTDRFEGPVTLADLVQSAQGTLAGKVPAVDLSL